VPRGRPPMPIAFGDGRWVWRGFLQGIPFGCEGRPTYSTAARTEIPAR
jgi:hypothetical protein